MVLYQLSYDPTGPKAGRTLGSSLELSKHFSKILSNSQHPAPLEISQQAPIPTSQSLKIPNKQREIQIQPRCPTGPKQSPNAPQPTRQRDRAASSIGSDQTHPSARLGSPSFPTERCIWNAIGSLVLTASSFATAPFRPRPRYDPGYHPNHLPGRDRSPSGPSGVLQHGQVQGAALSETSPYPQSSPGLGQPVARPASLPRTTSQVGTDLRAVRTADAALSETSPYPQSSPGLGQPEARPRVPSPNHLPGRDRSPSGPAPQTRRCRRHRPTPRAHRTPASL